MSNGCNMRFQTDSGFWPRKKKKNIINNLHVSPRLLNIKLIYFKKAYNPQIMLNPSSFVRLYLCRLEPTFLQLRNQYQLIKVKICISFWPISFSAQLST